MSQGRDVVVVDHPLPTDHELLLAVAKSVTGQPGVRALRVHEGKIHVYCFDQAVADRVRLQLAGAPLHCVIVGGLSCAEIANRFIEKGWTD